MTTDARPGRNDPCHCGSGRKYKQCCLDKDEAKVRAAQAKAIAAAPEPKADSSATPRRGAKHQTDEPWKKATTRGGFHKQVRTPRKVGGS
jgi:hypothetical protein